MTDHPFPPAAWVAGGGHHALDPLVAGALMFWLGSGPVKGFAVTLSLGVLTSLFSAILVTRLQIVTWLRRTKPKVIPI